MRIEGTKELEETREEQTQTETQEEEQEDALKSLLDKVDLNDPVIVEDARGKEVAITKQQFINFYLPAETSQLEAFHCFQQVRASGLNPLIKGQCHFFKTSDGPVSLFTGYEVYLARAYKNGMEHMEEPVWKIGEDGLPISCTLTIKIKGRPDFTRTTWYSEVVGLYNGKPNKRWDRAPFQMTEKCTTINTLRLAGIAAVDSLPYAIEEMPEPVLDGHRTLTQEQLDTLGEQGEAKPGTVTATDHQIDLTPLRKIYRGKLTEREIFPDDTMRKMWQSEIIGKASTADWDAMDFNNSTSEIESGRCEQWVQDNQPKPDPTHDLEPVDPPLSGDNFADNLPDIPPKQMFLDEAEKRFASIEDVEAWCKERISLTSWDEWTDANFETALPVLLEVPLLVPESATDDTGQSNTSIAETLFVSEASTRFASPEDRDAWVAMWTSKPRDDWSVSEYAVGTQKLMKLTELHPQNGTGEPEQAEPQAETQEGQEQPPAPASKATLASLSAIVKNFPGKKYMTVASKSFRARAKQTIKHAIASVSDLTEQEAQDIISSVGTEKAEITQKKLDALQEAKETGEIVDDDPLNQGEPLEDGMMTPEAAKTEAESQAEFQQEQAAWFESSEFAEHLNAYMIRSAGRFADAIKATAFHRDHGLTTPRYWSQEDFTRANVLHDALDAEDESTTKPEEPDGDECPKEQYDEMAALFSELMPDKNYAMGTEEARDIIYTVAGERFKYLNTISAAQASDVIHTLRDKIGDMKAAAEAKANKDPKVI